jgi:hypothetical protein
MTGTLRDDVSEDEPRDQADEATEPGPGLPPPSATESLVSALLEAGPEVAEHVVRAAQELLLAAQAIVDAAERAVQEQQVVRAQARAEADSTDEASGVDATVHHLDLAE